jgi:hypothetical protein
MVQASGAADAPILRCEGVAIRLLDVTSTKRGVRVSGIALRRLAGQVVTITRSGRRVATTTVAASGLFTVTAPPSRATNSRYAATVAGSTSRSLRLNRLLVITKRTSTPTEIRISGRLFARRRSLRKLTVRRQTDCTRVTATRTITTDGEGRFTLRLSRPTSRDEVAVYRLRTTAGGTTFTLPILVTAV